jgi:hypothetical protein
MRHYLWSGALASKKPIVRAPTGLPAFSPPLHVPGIAVQSMWEIPCCENAASTSNSLQFTSRPVSPQGEGQRKRDREKEGETEEGRGKVCVCAYETRFHMFGVLQRVHLLL